MASVRRIVDGRGGVGKLHSYALATPAAPVDDVSRGVGPHIVSDVRDAAAHYISPNTEYFREHVSPRCTDDVPRSPELLEFGAGPDTTSRGQSRPAELAGTPAAGTELRSRRRDTQRHLRGHLGRRRRPRCKRALFPHAAADLSTPSILPPGPSQLPSGRLLPGQLAYIALPGIDQSLTTPYLAAGSALMHRLQDNQLNGWIVDLRSDDGGAVWPMLGTTQPLLGSGPIGSFVSPPAPASVVRITPTQITDGTNVAISMPTAPRQNASTQPVVVLTGPETGSSGEFAAITFRGRPCTTTMGNATGGFPTSNTDYRLSDGATLRLTTAFEADRTGRVYPDAPIQPDVQVGAGNYFATWRSTDPAVRAAAQWLSLHRNCRR
ncbi:MAG: S41 family peptidase [Actinomycetota bacterium]|nr:S41 family peptidase [Actinomycetota bacterium]